MLSYIKFYADGIGRDVWQVFCLRHHGFERVWAGCRAPDRVGPKSGLQLFTIPHLLDFFFKFLAPTVRISLFKRTAHTHTQKSGLIFRYIEKLFDVSSTKI